MLAAGQDVDYIDPEEGECFFEDGTAIRKRTPNLDASEAFVTYTTCDDTKWLLQTQLLRQPAKDAVTNKDTSAEDLKQRLLSQQEVLSTWKTIMEEKGNEVHEQ